MCLLPLGRIAPCPTCSSASESGTRRSNRTANKRHHSSTDSVDLLNMPPSNVTIDPSSRVRSADGASSTSAVDSVRSLERSSSLNRAVADIYATAGMDVSQDTPLVDSVTSVSRDNLLVNSISLGHSGSGGRSVWVARVPLPRWTPVQKPRPFSPTLLLVSRLPLLQGLLT